MGGWVDCVSGYVVVWDGESVGAWWVVWLGGRVGG